GGADDELIRGNDEFDANRVLDTPVGGAGQPPTALVFAEARVGRRERGYLILPLRRRDEDHRHIGPQLGPEVTWAPCRAARGKPACILDGIIDLRKGAFVTHELTGLLFDVHVHAGEVPYPSDVD